jgi:DNA-binding response OmpR family regulator
MATIVVFEDEPALRDLLAIWLTEAGHTVRTHATGRPSADTETLADADLVVTDLMMPDCDGLEVIMNVRRVRPAAAIVAMSGGGRTVVRNLLPMARDLGARSVLEKPFMPHDLLDAVAQALR